MNRDDAIAAAVRQLDRGVIDAEHALSLIRRALFPPAPKTWSARDKDHIPRGRTVLAIDDDGRGAVGVVRKRYRSGHYHVGFDSRGQTFPADRVVPT